MKAPITIGIISDVHGNSYAMDAILTYFDRLGCDKIINCGDMLNIGAHSNKCIERLLGNSRIINLLGNHDIDFVNNRDQLLPYSHTPQQHKRYVFDSIDISYRHAISQLPLQYTLRHHDTDFAFMHYALADDDTSEYVFQPLVDSPTAEVFDRMFSRIDADVIFFGHKHEPIDIRGEKLYVDIGSLGCHTSCLARGIILSLFEDGSYQYDRVGVPYDREQLYCDMTNGELPYGKEVFDFYYDRKRVMELT